MQTNAIYCGDCRDVLKFEIDHESVDLIYLDPPFFSNKNYEIVFGDGSEVRSFEDRWSGGINHYTEWMIERLEPCRDALKETGSIYLHCDWHANHHLRFAMDRLFGADNMQNEIIWAYKSGGSTKKRFARKHDNIYLYSKNKDKFSFFPQKEKSYNRGFKPYRFQGVEEFEDEAGRWYTMVNMKDVWEIDMVGRTSSERLGYPTQKPEKLLERIIIASTQERELVLDPFCGCGTAIAVAQKMNRRWIGIDVSPIACDVMRERIRSIDSNITINTIGLPVSAEDLRVYDPFQFQAYICRKLGGKPSEKKSSDFGVDGYLFDKNSPIQVKQSDKVGRNAIDNFETAIRRKKKSEGVFVAYSFGKGAREEVARAKREDGIDIRLVTVSELMRG